MSNLYPCVVSMDGTDYKSSEHAYQTRLAQFIGREDLAQEIKDAPTPGRAKEVASRIPRSLHGNWHRVKLQVMQEILAAKSQSCEEFKQALIDSGKLKLVETVKSDRFWSCGLSPLEAQTTKPNYYPGENHLGQLLEHIRSLLLKDLRGNKEEQSAPVPVQESAQSDFPPPPPPLQFVDDINQPEQSYTPPPRTTDDTTPTTIAPGDDVTRESTEESILPPRPSPPPSSRETSPNPSTNDSSTKKKNKKQTSLTAAKSITTHTSEHITPQSVKKNRTEEDNMNTSRVLRSDRASS